MAGPAPAGRRSWAPRRLAQADSALAHVFGFHHLQVAGVLSWHARAACLLPGADRGAQPVLGQCAQSAGPPRGRARRAGRLSHRRRQELQLGLGSDLLTFSAWHKPSGTALIAALPTRVEGITVNPDWDAFGQRQTDSGTVRFDHVRLEAVQVLQAPGATPTARHAALAGGAAHHDQSVLGIAQGAYQDARGYVRDAAGRGSPRAWSATPTIPMCRSASASSGCRCRRPARWPTRRRRRWTALARGPSVTAEERGASPWPARRQVLAHRAALSVGAELFDVTGASSTHNRHGLDRHWRNARVHAARSRGLQDPRPGRYALLDQLPEPTPYS